MPARVPITPRPDPTSADTATLVDMGVLPPQPSPEPTEPPPDDGEQGDEPL
jgi:hypothetical protein